MSSDHDEDLSALGRLIPPELAEEVEPLALLKDGPERQTLLVRERETGEKLVLKRLLRPSEDAEKKFALLSGLAGGGIPGMRRFFRSGGAAYLLREYVEGESLLDLVQKKGPFPAKETARVGLSLCRTLRKLHGMDPPLIHRDIKAENIVRTPAGEFVLIDFDISRFYDRKDSRDTELRGTAFSAPPEQFGYRQTDPRSDIYALGVLLHELATGECRLEEGETPAPLRTVVNRCTRFDPKDRYPSVAALERALERAADGRRRSPLVPALCALLAVCALAGAAFWQRGSAAGDPEAYEFSSPAIEAEVCRQLGKQPGTVTRDDLTQITHLFLCGDEHFDSWWEMDIHGAELRVNGELGAEGGTVDTLEDIRYFPALQELALCNQRITDLTPLEGSWIQRLALHGNQIDDLSPLTSCEHLLDLYIGDNPVGDLSPLVGCRELCNLSAGATAMTDLTAVAAIPKLRFLSIMDCQDLADLAALGSMTKLSCLFIRPVREADLALIGGLTGLEQLYLWCDEPLEDMTALSALTALTHLFADMPVASLEGVETMTGMEFLDVRGTAPMDPSPLRGLTALEDLNAERLDTSALEDVLPALPFLRRVGCTAGQAEAVSRMLAGRPDVAVSPWE